MQSIVKLLNICMPLVDYLKTLQDKTTLNVKITLELVDDSIIQQGKKGQINPVDTPGVNTIYYSMVEISIK